MEQGSATGNGRTMSGEPSGTMNDTTTCIARAATLTGFTSAVSSSNGVQLRDLPPMTTLVVRTRNSEYQIVISSGDEVLVKGGHFFPSLTEARFSGASVGGSFLKVGWIGVGLRMEILAEGRRIITSPVYDILTRDDSSGRVH
jgi:hypothetical protein